MSSFTKDYQEISNNPSAGMPILQARKVELERIEREVRATKNGFLRQCLAQEWAHLKREYDELDALI